MSHEDKKHESDSGYKSSRREILSAGSAAAIATIAGCSSSESDESNNIPSADSVPQKPDSITVRAWGGIWQESINEAVAKPFTEDTGIEVNYDNSNFNVMRNKVLQALNQGRKPPVNVVWTQCAMMYKAYRDDMSANLNPDIVTNLSDMIGPQIPSRYEPDNGSVPYACLYIFTYPFDYNTEKLERIGADIPKSWDDLWESEYKDNIGFYPNGDGLYYPLANIAGVDLGSDSPNMQAMWDELEALAPNVGVTGTDSSLTNNLVNGEIAVSNMLPNNIIEAKNNNEPVDWIVPEEGTTARGDGMYTPAGQNDSETYWSQKFINYATDPQAQQKLWSVLKVPTLNKKASAPPDLQWQKDDLAFPTSQEELDKLMLVDPDVFDELSSEWFEKFNETIST